MRAGCLGVMHARTCAMVIGVHTCASGTCETHSDNFLQNKSECMIAPRPRSLQQDCSGGEPLSWENESGGDWIRGLKLLGYATCAAICWMSIGSCRSAVHIASKMSCNSIAQTPPSRLPAPRSPSRLTQALVATVEGGALEAPMASKRKISEKCGLAITESSLQSTPKSSHAASCAAATTLVTPASIVTSDSAAHNVDGLGKLVHPSTSDIL